MSWVSHAQFTKALLEGYERKDCEGKQRTVWDKEQKGLCVLVSPKTEKSTKNVVTLRALYYLDGKPKYIKIGRCNETTYYRDSDGELQRLNCWEMGKVRKRVADIRNRASEGIDPKAEPAPVIEDDSDAEPEDASELIENLIGQFVEHQKKQIRTIYETERILRRYVAAEWGERSIRAITPSDVHSLLSRIASRKFEGPKGRMLGTPQVADAVAAQLSTFFKWAVKMVNRDAEKKGKPRVTSPFTEVDRFAKNTARSRKLNDAEIAAMWKACDGLGVYGACVQMALVTAQRFFKVAAMRRSQIGPATIPSHEHPVTGVWIEDQVVEDVWDARTPDDPDNKQVSEVPLSPLAKSIIDRVPIIDADARDHVDYVFSLNGKKPFNGWSNAKEQLDAKMAEMLGHEVEPWQHRDLRRTARTLLSRAGVSRDISERCLAHVIGGVEGVYDRHDYLVEKKEAFARLAKLVDRIVNPPDATNVVELRTKSPR